MIFWKLYKKWVFRRLLMVLKIWTTPKKSTLHQVSENKWMFLCLKILNLVKNSQKLWKKMKMKKMKIVIFHKTNLLRVKNSIWMTVKMKFKKKIKMKKIKMKIYKIMIKSKKNNKKIDFFSKKICSLCSIILQKIFF